MSVVRNLDSKTHRTCSTGFKSIGYLPLGKSPTIPPSFDLSLVMDAQNEGRPGHGLTLPPTAIARLECGTVGTNSLWEVSLGLGQGTAQLYSFRSDSAVISDFQLRSMELETKHALLTIHSSTNIFLEINRLPPEVLARFHPSSQATRTSFSPPMCAITGAIQPSLPLRSGHPWTRKRCTKISSPRTSIVVAERHST